MAEVPSWRLTGDWFDVCRCRVPCGCTFAQAPDDGQCDGILAWHVREGSYGDVELAGPPQAHDSTERTVAVEVMAPDQAVSFLAGKGRAWEADLYRLAAERHAAAT
jgi:hypothetical protein